MAKNKIDDLRNHLFATLEDLRDPEKPMDLDRAKQVWQVAQQIIESAKVEVAMVKAISGSAPATGFFNLPEESRELPPGVRTMRAVGEGKKEGA